MSSTAPPAFRRFGPFIAGGIGLIFLIVGGVLLASQGWDRADGVVGACTTRVDRTETTSRTIQTCDVAWDDASGPHTAPIDLSGNVVPGQAVALRVNGSVVTQATPVWVGVGTLAIGLALLATSVVGYRRR
jgi:hypothetical protein